MKYANYIFFSLILLVDIAQAAELYVFVPANIRATVLERSLRESCPAIKITVFGRVKDFMNQVKTNHPIGILTLRPTMEQNIDYKLLVQGIRQGKTEEPYVFVSVGKEIDINNLTKLQVGVLDILGRKPMSKFMAKILKQEVKIRRVTKQEDLLSLLSFSAVDAIFVSQSLYEELTERTQLELIATPIDIRIGLASMASSRGKNQKALIDCIVKFDKKTNAALGVEKWTGA
jgi:hypothetical protein